MSQSVVVDVEKRYPGKPGYLHDLADEYLIACHTFLSDDFHEVSANCKTDRNASFILAGHAGVKEFTACKVEDLHFTGKGSGIVDYHGMQNAVDIDTAQTVFGHAVG